MTWGSQHKRLWREVKLKVPNKVDLPPHSVLEGRQSTRQQKYRTYCTHSSTTNPQLIHLLTLEKKSAEEAAQQKPSQSSMFLQGTVHLTSARWVACAVCNRMKMPEPCWSHGTARYGCRGFDIAKSSSHTHLWWRTAHLWCRPVERGEMCGDMRGCGGQAGGGCRPCRRWRRQHGPRVVESELVGLILAVSGWLNHW